MALAVRPPHEHSHLRPLTYDEVQQFPDDGYRYELVDGELLVTPAPNTAHQRAITQLIIVLAAAVSAEMEALVGPVDWYVRPTTCFEPDLVVVRRDGRADAQKLLEPPVLAVEVLSPSTRHRDVGLKLRAYEDAGLAWYWVVDPVEPRLTVHRLVDGRFARLASVAGDECYAGDEPFPVTLTPAQLVA
ncbi:MAG TPA: Uma2 family endonuclease [Acidimicrobiales bacterium]|nr:Uma2 family endonuclease [Acidimicrobiales bacterium]